jgi:hypothetical protein
MEAVTELRVDMREGLLKRKGPEEVPLPTRLTRKGTIEMI